MKKLMRMMLMGLALTGLSVFAQETETVVETVVETVTEMVAEPAAEEVVVDVNAYTIDNLFLFLCAVLVIFMQAGFAILECGLNHSKNTVNILTKNLMDFSLGVVLYFFLGYGLMYPGDAGNGWFGYAGVTSMSAPDAAGMAGGAEHTQVDFLFQAAFAATAATIVSGAVAGRMKFVAYLIYTVVLTGLIYPISGYWKWGGGWLNDKGFHDFAGSILVHAVGGFAGLAGAIVLGPRIGRFGKDKTPMPGHNITFATLGVFILLIGWYGFNPGSVLAVHGLDNVALVMTVAVNTTLAACTGAVFAMIASWVVDKKPDLGMALNGMLAGLVGITANADVVTNTESLIIGAVAGILVFAGCKLLEAVKIDDPVGAWPVHGLCGLWGGIATGIFGEGKELGAQILGSLVVPLYAFVTMFILFLILKTIGILRVSEEEEMVGLDLSEHGSSAYGD